MALCASCEALSSEGLAFVMLTQVVMPQREIVTFIMFTRAMLTVRARACVVLAPQVTPSFTLCQWRRDLVNLIQACLVDTPQHRL